MAGAPQHSGHDTNTQHRGPHRLSPCSTARPPSSPHTKSAVLGCIDPALSQALLQAQVLCVVAAWAQVAGLTAASKPAGTSRGWEHFRQAAWSQQGLRRAAGGQCTAFELAPGLSGSAARQMDRGNRSCFEVVFNLAQLVCALRTDLSTVVLKGAGASVTSRSSQVVAFAPTL